ncbi:MAG: hypothetical protein AAFY08_10770 [Planctomycetota bacterium]
MNARTNTPPSTGPAEGGGNILIALHYLMQGRYAVALIGALIVGGAAASYMWFNHKPLYTSQGWIRISPNKEVILNRMEDSNIPMFEQWVRVQAKLMTTPRVLDLAMDSPTWAEREAGTGPNTRGWFESRVRTRVEATQVISVSFEDENPRTAQKGVESVLKAYNSVYGEVDSAGLNRRLERLESVRAQLLNEMRGIRQRKGQLAERYGTDDFTTIINAKQDLLFRYQVNMQEIERLIKLQELPDDSAAAVASTVDAVTVADLAGIDPETARLVTEQEQLDRDYRNSQALYGERHRQVVRLRDRLRVVEEDIEQRLVAYRAGQLDLPLGPGVADATGATNLAQLRGQADEYNRLRAQTREELEELNRQRIDIEEVDQQIAKTQIDLDKTNALIDQIQIESAADSRVELVNVGDVPSTPSNADDKFTYSAMAGVVGGSFVVGLCLLWGVLDRRLRSYGQARNHLGADAFVGVLSELDPDLSDPQKALATSHAIHEIRSLVHRGVPDGQPLVLGITSATSGAGKTSASLALGVSFAATGCRTLMIDFDAVGGGLSSRTQRILRRRHAQRLVDQRLVPADRRDELVAAANDARMSVTKAAEHLGLVSASRAAEALGSGPAEGVGVFEALSGTPLYDCVRETDIDHLAVLPIGSGNVTQVGTVARARIRELIQQARSAYDVVIIDSGPMLGSLEASIIAGEVDEMLLVVARGELVGHVRRAIDSALDSGARIAGLIFNKAQDTEAQRFSSSSVTSRTSTPDVPDDAATITLRDASECPVEFGPLAYATAACLPKKTRAVSTPPPRHQGAA